MALDQELIRKRLETLKNQTRKSDQIWRPQPGKNRIRIVPYKFQPGNPFIELYFHYELGRPASLSLKTFGEADPVCEFAAKLKRTGSKDDWKQGNKIEPKLRTYVAVVVRGKEKEGIKFWGFGKTIYQKLLSTIAEPEWGDITDPHSGRDISVTFKPKDETGAEFDDTDIDVLPSQVPLTNDAELMERLLDNQKNIYDVFSKPTYDELLDKFDKYMNPTEDETRPEMPAPAPKKTTAAPKAETPKATKDVGKAFDELFEKSQG